MQEKENGDSIEEIEDVGQSFTLEDGQLLDELTAKEEAKLPWQEAKTKS